MRITERMPAGIVYQIFASVSARIYPRSQRESRLAHFGEDYAPFAARCEICQVICLEENEVLNSMHEYAIIHSGTEACK